MTPPTLRTERLVLRAWAPADAQAAYDVYSDDQVWPWLGAQPAPVADLDAARARIERWAGLGDAVLGFWAIQTPGMPGIAVQPCGSVILLGLPRSDGEPSDAVEIGWHLHPSAWGQGIATEAASALVERARAGGLRRLHAVVNPDNVRSLAVCDRLGMTRLGLTDEWYGVLFVDHVLEL